MTTMTNDQIAGKAAWEQFVRMRTSNPGDIANAVLRALREAGRLIDPSDDIDCADHEPVQHRDGKPPWCNECGLTAGGTKPVSRWDQPARDTEAAPHVTDPCHCGAPVHQSVRDGATARHRGMCERCDAVRCDVAPEACRQLATQPVATDKGGD